MAQDGTTRPQSASEATGSWRSLPPFNADPTPYRQAFAPSLNLQPLPSPCDRPPSAPMDASPRPSSVHRGRSPFTPLIVALKDGAATDDAKADVPLRISPRRANLPAHERSLYAPLTPRLRPCTAGAAADATWRLTAAEPTLLPESEVKRLMAQRAEAQRAEDGALASARAERTRSTEADALLRAMSSAERLHQPSSPHASARRLPQPNLNQQARYRASSQLPSPRGRLPPPPVNMSSPRGTYLFRALHQRAIRHDSRSSAFS